MPKKNAFFWFMLEHKKRLEAKGHRFRSLKDVIPLAGKIWEKMDANERERYASADVKKAPSTAVRPKPASASNNRKSMNDKSNEKSKECKHLTVAMLQERLHQAELDDTIEKLDFYIISIEYFCLTDDGIYVPAELAVIKYSLECGVQEQLHMLINPGKLPCGYALRIQQHAAVNHALPLPPNALGETDFDGIALKLLAFLAPEADANLPMLFTAANGVPVVESILQRMLGNRIKQRTLHVCNIVELFYHLKLAVERHMMSTTLFPSLTAAQQMIDADPYSFASQISCEYHESRELLEHCALSRCIRWAYTISGNCSKELGIDLIPGKHLPIDWIAETVAHLPDDGGCTVSANKSLARFDDAIVERNEPGCSGNKKQRYSPLPVERSKPETALFEMLEQQSKGVGNAKAVSSIREPQVLDDDEIRRAVVKKVNEFETFNMGPGRGRALMMNLYRHPTVMGRGSNHLPRGGHNSSVRGRGYITPIRGRGR